VPVPLRRSTLTLREREVMKLLAEGHTSKKAAAILGLSTKTVEAHKFNLMRKLDIHNKAQLVTVAIQQKILPMPFRCESSRPVRSCELLEPEKPGRELPDPAVARGLVPNCPNRAIPGRADFRSPNRRDSQRPRRHHIVIDALPRAEARSGAIASRCCAI